MSGPVGFDCSDVFLPGVDKPPDQRRVGPITPATSSQPPKTRPAIRSVTPIAAMSGRNDGPGRCTPGGVFVDDDRQCRDGACSGLAVVQAEALGEPVEQRQRRARSPSARIPAEHEAQHQQEHADRGEDRRERRARQMDPGRRLHWIRLHAAPHARGTHEAPERPDQHEDDQDRDADRDHPMSLPQSGVTNWAVISRIEVQRRSSIGRRLQCARRRAPPVTPSTIRLRGRRP